MSRVRPSLVGLLALVISTPLAAQTVNVGAYGLAPLTCLAPQGEIVPGVPVAYLCGRDGLLDDPIDSFLRLSVRTRAGVVNPQGTSQLLRVARAYLTGQPPTLPAFDDLFAELSSLPTLDQPGVPQQVRNGLARALRAEELRDPAFAPTPAQQALLTEWAASLNARFPSLLEARREPDRADFVFTQRLGAGPVADTVAESAMGMASNLAGGITMDDVTGPIEQQDRTDRIPYFIGPDGLLNTADDLPIQPCRSGLMLAPNGRCSSDGSMPAANDVTAEPIYYVLGQGISAEDCWEDLGNRDGGGVNMNGECIIFSTFGRPGVSSGATLAAADLAFDPAFRPAAAALEPTDLVDLRLRSVGGEVPARPRGPGGLVFPPTGGTGFARRVDPETGAPVNATGPLECNLRLVGGMPAGADGDPATTFDNRVPTDDNCLLFSDLVGGEAQVKRARDAIAASHPADQTGFTTLCAVHFDEDAGQCALDFLNDYDLWSFYSRILAGDPLVQGLSAEGYQFARPAGDPADPLDRARFTEFGDFVFSTIFARLPVIGTDSDIAALSFALADPQKALLGCGDAFLLACDVADQARMSTPEYAAMITDQAILRTVGGVDLLHADASVITQDFTVVKALQSGALVGTRTEGVPRFEAGISGASVITPDEAEALGVTAWQVARDRLAIAQFGVPYAQLAGRAQQSATATDFQVEPPRWLPDPSAPSGVLLFQDPRGADGMPGTADDAVSPSGEDCTNAFSRPAVGCTALEVISANLERYAISSAIVGPSKTFDPPETVAEIQAILDGDPANDATGDPVAGEDGIRFNDFDSNGDGVVSDGVNELGDQKALLHRGSSSSQAVADNYLACLVTRALNSPVCYLNLDRTSVTQDPGYNQGPAGQPIVNTTQDRIVAALPIGVMLSFFDGSADTAGAFRGTAVFPIQRLSAVELQEFVANDRVTVSASRFTEAELAIVNAQLTSNPQLGPLTLDDVIALRPQGQLSNSTRFCPGGQVPCFVTTGDSFRRLMLSRTIDGNQTSDLDEDDDNTFDFVDDGTQGPVTANNILCGSGVPGDSLQDAAQHELDARERARLAAAFPGGFPPRSPTFCGFTNFLLGLTGESSPGRRDFLWHGGAPSPVPGETDGDGFPDQFDTCATLSNADQLDFDADGAGDVCDNCVETPNSRLADLVATLTYTGGQRDDDADGYGNACDADFDQTGPVVTAADFNEMKASVARLVRTSTCGASGTDLCARYDLDGVGPVISSSDFNRAKALVAQPIGPRCDDCGDFDVLPCVGPACAGP